MAFWKNFFGLDGESAANDGGAPVRATYTTPSFSMPDESVYRAEMVKRASGLWAVITHKKNPDKRVTNQHGSWDTIFGSAESFPDGEMGFVEALSRLSQKEQEWSKVGTLRKDCAPSSLQYRDAALLSGCIEDRAGNWTSLQNYGLPAGFYREEDFQLICAHKSLQTWISEAFLSEDGMETAEQTVILRRNGSYGVMLCRKPKGGDRIEAVPIPYQNSLCQSWPLTAALEYLGVQECANRLKKKTCVLAASSIPPERYFKDLAAKKGYVIGAQDGRCIAYDQRNAVPVLESDLRKIESHMGVKLDSHPYFTTSDDSAAKRGQAPLSSKSPAPIQFPVGAWIPGEGVYIEKTYIRELSKKFNVFASPEDALKNAASHRKIASTISKFKNWYGHNGLGHEMEGDIFEVIGGGAYNGEWFIPAIDMMSLNLISHQDKGVLKGSFAAATDKHNRYTSSTAYRKGFYNDVEDIEESVTFFRCISLLGSSEEGEHHKVRCRPMRLSEIKG